MSDPKHQPLTGDETIPINNAESERVAREGGPAFPVSLLGYGDNGWQGMTLRDYFAGQVITTMALSVMSPHPDVARRLAENAYMIADAMVQVRKKDPKNAGR